MKSAGRSTLSDPSSPLSKMVPSSLIEEANKEVAVIQNAERRRKKHSPFMIVSLEQKAVVRKYAADHGTTKAMCHFAKDMLKLKESTVRGWKTAYLRQVQIQAKAGREISVKQHPEILKGPPLLLGQDLDWQV